MSNPSQAYLFAGGRQIQFGARVASDDFGPSVRVGDGTRRDEVSVPAGSRKSTIELSESRNSAMVSSPRSVSDGSPAKRFKDLFGDCGLCHAGASQCEAALSRTER